jgi:hypothetical protein
MHRIFGIFRKIFVIPRRFSILRYLTVRMTRWK